MKVAADRLVRLWQLVGSNAVAQALCIYTMVIIILICPTFGLYMWSGHDQLFPVIRVYEVCKVWRAQSPGHVPWAPDWAFGYGYPFHSFTSHSATTSLRCFTSSWALSMGQLQR
jgi:hypothetical protein